MTLDEYQTSALLTAVYPDIGRNVLYPTLGLTGEAGEVANKVKKLIRDEGYQQGDYVTNSMRATIGAELGDVLWYVATLAHELGYTLEEIADANLIKLAQRSSAGTLKGEGDNR